MVLKVLHYSMYRTHCNYQFYDSFLLQTTSTLTGGYDSFTSMCLILSTVAFNLFVYARMLVKIAYVCTCVFVHIHAPISACMYLYCFPLHKPLSSSSHQDPRGTVGTYCTSCAVKPQRHSHGS